MSTLSKKEKQALNELFMSLDERNNMLNKIKKLRNKLVLFVKYKLKKRKAKHPFL